MNEILVDLFGQVDRSGNLPTEVDARNIYDRYIMMSSEAIFSNIAKNSFVRSQLPIVKLILSGQDPVELRNALIVYLDEHYHELMMEIDQDEERTKMFGEVLNMTVNMLVGKDENSQVGEVT